MENKYQVNFADEFIFGNNAIKYEVSTDKMLYLNVQDCAIALDITDKSKGTNKIERKRVYRDLIRIDAINDRGLYKKLSDEDKKKMRNYLKQLMITKQQAVMWASFCSTQKAIEFSQFLDMINYDNIYKINSIYIHKANKFFDILEVALMVFDIRGIREYKVLNYRIDYYIPSLNIAIEYDENNHKGYSYEQHEGRQKEIEKELGCRFIRVTDEKEYNINANVVVKEIVKIRYPIAFSIINSFKDVNPQGNKREDFDNEDTFINGSCATAADKSSQDRSWR